MNEYNKLKKVFSSIPENKKKICDKLIQSAAFMAEELSKLEEYIAEHGSTEEYQNGANQFGKKKSSEVEVYNAMIKNYASIVKQLIDLLPEEADAGEELRAFIKKKYE